MYLLLDVNYSNPDADLRCQCAVLELTPALCTDLQQTWQAVLRCRDALPDLHKAVFWRQAVEFYGGDLVDDCDLLTPGWRNDFSGLGFAAVPPAIDLQRYEPCDTECQQQIVRYDAMPSEPEAAAISSPTFQWMAIPKHNDLYVITREVSLPMIVQHLAATGEANHHAKIRLPQNDSCPQLLRFQQEPSYRGPSSSSTAKIAR